MARHSAERRRLLRIEPLEQRALLSSIAVCDPIRCDPIQAGGSGVNPATSPPGFTPAEIQTAYGISSISLGGVSGTGAGQTIAIIDAYNDPNIISDAAAFNSQFGLQQFNSGGPTFKVLNETGGATLPGNASTGSRSWSVEESLDVEWAHSVAPQANIILFEASSASMTDMMAAVQTAAAYSGVSVVSMSWSEGDNASDETTYDPYFTTPAGHANVTFLASTGDSGAPGGYPAFSPNVIAVGGTSLYYNSSTNTYSETAWSSGGGGASSYESEPSYQTNYPGLVDSTGKRETPERLLRCRSQHRRAHLRFL